METFSHYWSSKTYRPSAYSPQQVTTMRSFGILFAFGLKKKPAELLVIRDALTPMCCKSDAERRQALT